jgi:hypothetical protein
VEASHASALRLDVRQKNAPNLAKGMVTDGHFQMNFKPKCRVGARVPFRIKEAGN